MRIAVALLLTFTASCTTDTTGLEGHGGFGGTGPVSGSGGWANVGGAAGTGGMPATGGTGAGGADSAGTGGMAGSGGTAGTGGTAGAGGTMPPLKSAGTACAAAAECATGYCFDGVCCQTDCSGACRSCANAAGTCTLAAQMTDPREDCPATAPETCGTVGTCDGKGACAMVPAGTVCSSTPACDSTSTAVVMGAVCNVTGVCVPGPSMSCDGFTCAAGACQTSCSDDSGCAPGAFCAGHACITVANLAGNGDLETGTLTGWSSLGSTNALALSSPAASGYAHRGQYAAELTGRTLYYQGPAYALPTGLGRYTISVWAMQLKDTSDTPLDLVAELQLTCSGGSSYVPVQMGGFGMSAPAGTWIEFAGQVDTHTDPNVAQGCFPDGALPGVVKSAMLWISQAQPDPSSSSQQPDLYVDDLVVQSGDGHNLVGNPNFESGATSGWSTLGGTSTLVVSNTTAHAGHASLWQTARGASTAAIAYALPIGAARYAVSLWVMQSGTADHQLALLPVYSCIGSSTGYVGTPSPPIIAAPSVWTQLSGTFVFPPAGAPAGCVLSQAAVAVGQGETGDCGSSLECPDLFVDDASITLK